jgi:hypothetical protein
VNFLKDSANCKPSSPSPTSLAHQTLSLCLNKKKRLSEERRRRSQLHYIEVFSHLFFLLHVLLLLLLTLFTKLPLHQETEPKSTDRQTDTDRQSFGEEEGGGPRQTLSRAATKWGKNKKNSNLQREGERGWVGR